MLEFIATLRVSSNYICLDEIQALLGSPSRGFSKGDTYGRKNNQRNHTFWSITSESKPDDELSKHLEELIDFLSKHENEILQLKTQCDIDIVCMLSSDNGQGGCNLPPHILAKVSEYGLNLAFDIYSG